MNYDSSTESKLLSVFPGLASIWRAVAQEMWDLHQVQIKVTEGLRTFSQQWDCWHQGRLKDKGGEWVICDIRKVVTYAMPGKSFHQYGLAIDSAFMGSDPYLSTIVEKDSQFLWNEYGRLCKKHGLVWGGDFKHADRPHCENSYGLSLIELQILYEDKGLKGLWNKCKILSECGGQIT